MIRFAWLPAIVLLLVLAGCSSGNGDATQAASTTASEATPTPTEPTAVATITAESEDDSSEEQGTKRVSSSAVDDLSDLPDDPQALMLASLNRPLSRVARKMAESGNKTFIPVLLEFMRFQRLDDKTITVSSFMSRIKDNIPLD
jgi:hypothetical protein